ncbi:MAG: hypothetical protein V4792_19870 [Pseudomonadota bacterium]
MDLPTPDAEGRLRVAIAQRVADAHCGIDDASLLSFVSGSTVEGLADVLSDVDMSVVFADLPDEARLREACRHAGGSDWFWHQGSLAAGGMVVAFHVDAIEVQIGYSSLAQLTADIDQLLVGHDPDTPNHKLAEGVLKALPLVGAAQLAALQARLAQFPPALGRAMVVHGLATPMPWRAAKQLLQRDAALWCREIQIDACYRLLLMLCGLNGRYFTRFQVKRMHRLASLLGVAPPALAERIEALLAAPPPEAFALLHRLEGEVLDLVVARWPDLDLGEVRKRRAAFAPP